jgi:hypothetical protein
VSLEKISNLPQWALRTATPADRLATQHAYQQNTMLTNWDACQSLKQWAKQQGWRTPWFGFQSEFFKTMLENDENFALVLTSSGLKLTIPVQSYDYPDTAIQYMDDNYENHSWGSVVAQLREMRRAVEAGVVVYVNEKPLKNFNSFYTWAHNRYHALEDGYDSWIGHDID